MATEASAAGTRLSLAADVAPAVARSGGFASFTSVMPAAAYSSGLSLAPGCSDAQKTTFDSEVTCQNIFGKHLENTLLRDIRENMEPHSRKELL